MKIRPIRLLILFAGLCVVHFYTAVAADNFSTIDSVGRKVVVNKPPSRIVCIAPGSLRLLTYLGVQEKIVGIEDMEKRFPTTRPYFIANPGYKTLPSVGSGGPNAINKEPDYEKILSVKPDIVFISYMERGLADRVEKKLGTPVFVVSYGPFGAFSNVVFDTIVSIGKIVGESQRADAVVNFIDQQRADLKRRTDESTTGEMSVYIGGIGFKGTQGLTSTETNYAPFEWAGITNIASQENKTGHLFISKEELLLWNPDIIFVDGGGKANVEMDIQKSPRFYNGLAAFQKEQVYLLHSFNWYMTNLGTVITDAYTAGKILFPKQFMDIDIARKADEVYTALLGKPLYKELEELHGPLGQKLLKSTRP